MSKSRREFLQIGSLAVAGAVLAGNRLMAGSSIGRNDPFGIQLWSVRSDMNTNAAETLKLLAGYGYRQIESCDLGKSIFWGMKPGEFKMLLDDLGMSMPSAHCDIFKNFEETAANAAAVGVKYLICPWLGPQKTLDDYKKAADNFNTRGEICRKNGIRFAYHNHDYSFKLTENQFPQDVMMTLSNPDIIDFEMDMYWVVTAGQDPIKWLKKYENRFKLCHIKDRKKNAQPEDSDASCNLGTGIIDFQEILPIAKRCGMEYFHVEQEKWEGSTPLDSARDNAKFMSQLKF
jgi:sugar phosphate isomerase/epimerase